jgi:Galactose oxidase, central domain
MGCGRMALARAVVVVPALIVLTALLGAAKLGAQTPSTSHLPSQVLTWAINGAGDGPPPLVNASMVYDSDTQTIVVFGGQTSSGGLSNDTWVWNGSTWTRFQGSHIQAPPARQLAAMAFDPDLHQLILFGGQGAGGQPLGDTWAWNGVSWYHITPSASVAPQARFGAAMAYDAAGQVVLFGGTGSTQPQAAADPPAKSTTPTTAVTGTSDTSTSSDTASVSTPSVSTPSVSAPSVSASSVGASSVGAGPLISLKDTWLWNGTSWVVAAGPGPAARSDAAMAYDSTTAQTLLFGGQSDPAGSSPSHLLADTWTWNGSRWSQQRPKTTPPARASATLSDGPNLASAVLFGGTGTRSQLGDTWLWSGTEWLKAPAGGGPVPTSGAAAAYDPATGNEMVLGGTSGGSAQATEYLLIVSPKSLAGPPSPPSTNQPAGGNHPTSSTTSPPAGGANATIPQQSSPPAVRATPATNTPQSRSGATLRPGSLVTLSGSGFRPGSVVTITFHSAPVLIGRVLADQFGVFSATVTVPVKAPAGAHHFEASGMAAGGKPIQLLAAVTVLGSGRGSDTSLAQTIALVGAALLIPGAAWLVMSGAGWIRRRSGNNLV